LEARRKRDRQEKLDTGGIIILKKDISEISCGGIDFIHLVQDSDQ
jgi:hypothetical protein